LNQELIWQAEQGPLFIPSLAFSLVVCLTKWWVFIWKCQQMKFAVNQEKEREKVAQLVQRVWTHLVPAEVGRVGALGCIPCPGYFLTECSPATIKKKKCSPAGSPALIKLICCCCRILPPIAICWVRKRRAYHDSRCEWWAGKVWFKRNHLLQQSPPRNSSHTRNTLIPSLIYQYSTETVKLNFHLGQRLHLFTTVQWTMPWIASFVQTSLTRALHWY